MTARLFSIRYQTPMDKSLSMGDFFVRPPASLAPH